MAKLSTPVIVGLSALGAAAILGVAYVVAQQNNATAAAALLNTPAAAPGPGGPVSTLTTGAHYVITAVAPAGTPDGPSLATALNQSGWSNTTVTAFTAAGAAYTAMATWAGANGAAVPAGTTITSTA